MSAREDDPSPLAKYRKKRDPGRTNEPFSPELAASAEHKDGASAEALLAARRQPTWVGAFVVHEHHATRRHFDLRLEMGGVLLSFAVPRGPTLDPEERRLAIQTEHHPLAYVDYEGVIPEPNYGAGSMIVWDVGQVRYLENDAQRGLAQGKLDFELAGYKLRGRFALVRTRGGAQGGEGGRGRAADRARAGGQTQWILLKKRDLHAAPDTEIVDALPSSVLSGLRAGELAHAAEHADKLAARALACGAVRGELRASKLVPMACAIDATASLDSHAHLYELKLDGVRILAEKRGDEVELYYRKGRSATASYPELSRAIKALPPRNLVLDGEVVAYDARGRPDFQKLAQRFSVTRPHDVRRAQQTTPVSFVVFDLLAVADLSLLGVSLIERKALLAQLIPARGPIRALDHLEGDGRSLFEFCEAQRLEGVIAKRINSPYRPGPHAYGDWVKHKCEREADFVVVGFTRGQGSRELGALDLASYETNATGPRLVSRGKVGSGLDEATLALLLSELGARRSAQCAAEGGLVPAPRGRVFVRPELVVSVRYAGFTRDGHLRHPVFRGLRADIDPHECTASPHDELRELTFPRASADPGRGAPDAQQAPPDQGAPPGADDRAQTSTRERVRISNPNKVYWPVEGYTKGELCAYYEAVAPVLLPFLRDRPVILVRYPDGIDGKNFYQWNVPRGTPSWVRTVRVSWDERADGSGKQVDLFLINDVDTLRYIANLGCIPLHILAARVTSLASCDFLTIDFDLNGQPLAHAITLARELEQLLHKVGLRGFPKTSGQTGLHVLVGLGPSVPFETARTLAELLGRLLLTSHPTLATMERTKAKRGPRLYIDTGQTGTTRAIVAPYSVRAYRGARVSTPLSWDEVGFALDPAQFTIASVIERVAQHGDPMAGLLAEGPDLAAAIESFARLLPRT